MNNAVNMKPSVTPWSYVELSNGGHTLVEDADLSLIADTRWRWKKDGRGIYVHANNTNRSHPLHRRILGLSDPRVLVDHINGNGLDNRRSNLRICNNSENQRNRQRYGVGTSTFKGVTWHKQCKKWQSQIKIAPSKSLYLGLFDNPEDAARAYDAAALEHFGHFAAINFPMAVSA